jgi:hypothetical protein
MIHASINAPCSPGVNIVEVLNAFDPPDRWPSDLRSTLDEWTTHSPVVHDYDRLGARDKIVESFGLTRDVLQHRVANQFAMAPDTRPETVEGFARRNRRYQVNAVPPSKQLVT